MALRKKKRKQIDDFILTATGLQVKEPKSTREHDKLAYLVNAILNVLIVLGTIGCFMESLSIEWNPVFVVPVIVVCAVSFSFFYRSVWLRFFSYIIIVIVFVVGTKKFVDYFMSGLAIVLNRFIEIFGQWFNVPIGDILAVVKSNSASISVTVFLVVFSIFLILFFNIIISQVKSYWVILVFTFPFVQIPMYCQREMPMFYFLLYIVGVTCLFCLRISGHFYVIERNERNFSEFFKKKAVVYSYKSSGRTNLAVLGLVSVTVAIATVGFSIVYPQNKFKSGGDFAWRQSIDDLITSTLSSLSFSKENNLSVNGDGGVDIGKMGNTRFLKQDGLPDLFVYVEGAEEENNIYVHACRSSTYYDNSWLEDSIATRVDSQPGDMFVCLDSADQNFLGAKERRMYIENVGASKKYYYFPYWDSGSIAYFEDEVGSTFWTSNEALSVPEIKEIVTKVHRDGNPLVWEDFFSWEEAYREKIYQFCLDVDEEQKERLLELLHNYGIQEKDADVVEEIQLFLRENYKYTLVPGITPEGEDFVDYFLFEQGEGYCTYFASAAVLLYRSLGIPARYVTGYVVPQGDSLVSSVVSGPSVGWDVDEVTQVMVSDKNAHAWVEIYIDGFGWYPIEVTTSEMAEEPSQNSWSIFEILAGAGKRIFGAVVIVIVVGAAVVCLFRLLQHWRWKHGGEEVLLPMFFYLVDVSSIGYCRISRNLPIHEIVKQVEKQYGQEEELQQIVSILEKSFYSNEQLQKAEVEQCKSCLMAVVMEVKKTFSLWQRLKFWYF